MKSIKTKIDNIIDKKTTSSVVNEKQADSNGQKPKSETDDHKSKKIALFNKKFDYENHEDDEVVKDDYDPDEDDFEINEIVVNDSKSFTKKMSSKYRKRESKRESSNIKKEILNNQSDSASSSESGFGTVDDEIESHKNNVEKCETNLVESQDKEVISQNNVIIENKQSDSLVKKMLQQQKSVDSNTSESANLTPAQISFPILQPPKLVAYELNHSDDVVNILNDNSSMNSSTSSTNTSNSNCCIRLFEKILTFLCSCFCCYSPNSQNNQPLVCSWLTIFCCCCPILGGISLFLNHRSKKYKQKQKYELADRYSSYAEKLNIAALILGIIFYAIGFFILTLVLFIYWKVNHF